MQLTNQFKQPCRVSCTHGLLQCSGDDRDQFTIATVGGLSKEQFQNCVVPTEREMKALKRKKLAEESVKVPHTPYIFIGGEAYEGERTFEATSKFIDKKLAELDKKQEKK